MGLLVDRRRLESLQGDLVDLQGVLISVFSRAGAVRRPSWKFPHKASCDLDLVALLERHAFAESNPEFTHQSHVALLELVIDRLLLLLQSVTEYAENLTSQGAAPSPKAAGPSVSVGSVARKHWESVLKLGTLRQQLATEEKSNNEDGSLQVAAAENKHAKSSCSERSDSDVTILGFQASSLSSSAGSGLLCGNFSEAKSAPGPSRPVRSVPSQTVESSPAPCDACEKAQLSLREVGSAIISTCNSQNLPSSLSRFLEMVEETHGCKPLMATDISYWAAEQSKDLSRINKHLRMLTGLVGPLKEELEASQKQEEELRRQLEAFEGRLQGEKEAQEQQRKEAELLFEKRHRENLQLVARLEKEKDELQNKALSLEKNISALKEKLELKEAAIQELEQAKTNLLQEVRTKMVDKAEVRSREERLEVLASQLEAAKQQLGWATTELDKEKAKVESMLRHKESLQAKQRALTQQLDRMDQECEQLRASLADGEEEHSVMEERLKEVQEGKWQAQHQLEAQQKLTEKVEREKRSMEQSACELQRTLSELRELVQEMKEREKLLVFFPDLHAPVEAQFESTGDVVEDMGKQLQANNIRISILEEENTRLRAVVAKIKAGAQQEGPKLIPPTQLWIQSAEDDLYEDGGRHSPTGHPVAAGIPGAAMRHRSHPANAGSTAQGRSRSGHGTGSGSAASQRTLGNHSSKPPSREAARKPSFAFTYEDVPYARMRERNKGSALCSRNHQK